MVNLDKTDSFKALDTQGQLSWIANWSNSILQSFEIGKNIQIPDHISTTNFNLHYLEQYSQITICAMGGSAISGTYLKNYLDGVNFFIPITIVRGYTFPDNIPIDSLVLIVSYSGNTRETLSCLYQSIKRNMAIVIISSGGTCLEFAKKYNIPFVTLPKGFQQRAAFPLILGGILGVVCKQFLELHFLESELASLADLLDKHNSIYEAKNPSSSNLAKQLAIKWLDQIPIFFSEFECLGMRMKGQMNENAQKMAFYDTFPEMMHNSTQSWKDQYLSKLPFQLIRIIINDNPEMIRKTNYALELAKQESVKIIDEIDFTKETTNPLHRLLLSTYLIDYISIYIAFLENLDPSDADIIVGMKTKFDPELKKEFDFKSALLSL